MSSFQLLSRQYLFKVITSIFPFNVWLVSLIYLPAFAEGLATYFNITLIYYAFKNFSIPFLGIPWLRQNVIPVENVEKILYACGFVIATLSGLSIHRHMEEIGKKIPLSICCLLSLAGYSTLYSISNVLGLETWLNYILQSIVNFITKITDLLLGNWGLFLLNFFSGFIGGLSISTIYIPTLMVLFVYLVTYLIMYACGLLSNGLSTLVMAIFKKFRDRPMSGFFLSILVMFSIYFIKVQVMIFTTLLIITFVQAFIFGVMISIAISFLLLGFTIGLTAIWYITFRVIERFVGKTLLNPIKAIHVPSEIAIIMFLIFLATVLGLLPPIYNLIQFVLTAVIFMIIMQLIGIAITGLPRRLKQAASLINSIGVFVTILVIAFTVSVKPTITHCLTHVIEYKTSESIDEPAFCIQCANTWIELNEKEPGFVNKIIKPIYCKICKPEKFENMKVNISIPSTLEISYNAKDVVEYMRKNVFKCS